MTLLFFLRSPAGNTDTGRAPDAVIGWDRDDSDKPKKGAKKLREKAARKARKLLAMKAAEEEARRRLKKKKRDKEEELLMLFMHEFTGYDD